MATIGLCMIVKNEAAVIARCLQSVASWIDTWTIVDTGSTDNTVEVIESTTQALGIPGRLHHRLWQDFGHNRSEAIELARAHSDYLLFIDADEVLQWQGGSRPALQADAYSYIMQHGELRYERIAIVSTRLPWRYVGVLHEYPDCGQPIKAQVLHGLSVLYGYDGARSRNPQKFLDDAAVLERALKVEPANARYWFYLAQSWRDAGCLEKAVVCYEQRASMGDWEEEAWYSQYQVARLQSRLGLPLAQVCESFRLAYERRPSRAESLLWWAVALRAQQQWHSALLLLKAAFPLSLSTDSLFVEPDCYGWRCADELALALFHTNCKTDAHKAWSVALKLNVPAEEQARIEANMRNC